MAAGGCLACPGLRSHAAFSTISVSQVRLQEGITELGITGGHLEAGYHQGEGQSRGLYYIMLCYAWESIDGDPGETLGHRTCSDPTRLWLWHEENYILS